MELTNNKLLELIKRRNGKDFNIAQFVRPSESDFLDVHKLKNIDAAAQKIKEAASCGKKILIYGDYDSDGICSCTLLYLFLKGIGADVDVFIPNRFENGYGISIDAIEQIEEEFSPDLIITVDLGITAVEEVEIIKQEGIDIVVTDHHLPLSEIPDCIVVDPKICVEDYGFDGLCGAGVALKLVEAMSDRETMKNYLDIAAIATVGDIVPLVSENRAIARLGIEKINRGDCLKSIAFLLKKLEIEQLTSSDISFKIVPRLNACGRMDNAKKVFEFLIETNEELLQEKYIEIDADNQRRLEFIDRGREVIEKCLSGYSSDEPSILIEGDFHEGIVGILASRVVHDYGRPTIIFTKNEDGNLRGSGRSIDGIDLHSIIAEMDDILINFGGHKMAIGLEISPENFGEFKRRLNEKLGAISDKKLFLLDDFKYDILLDDADLSDEFLQQIELLEPFGCENECPIFVTKQGALQAQQVSEKSFKHFKLPLKTGAEIMAFSAFPSLALIRSNSEKLLSVEITRNVFKQRSKLAIYLKKILMLNPNFSGMEMWDLLVSVKNLYYSLYEDKSEENLVLESDIKKVIKQKLSESDFGTLVVLSSNSDIEQFNSLNLDIKFSTAPLANGQNTVLANPFKELDDSKLNGYKNIIFIHKFFNGENLRFTAKHKVFEPAAVSPLIMQLTTQREVLVNIYKIILSNSEQKACNEYDFAIKLSEKFESFSAVQIFFSMLVFFELNFFEFDENSCNIRVLKSKKVDLASSKLYTEVAKYV